MRKASLDALEAELGAPPPDSFRALPQADIDRIQSLLAEARANQDAVLSSAADAALAGVPRLLRRPVEKILGR